MGAKTKVQLTLVFLIQQDDLGGQAFAAKP